MRDTENCKQLFLQSTSEEIKENNLKKICGILENEVLHCTECSTYEQIDFLKKLMEYKQLCMINPIVDFSQDAFSALEMLVRRNNNNPELTSLPINELTKRRFILGNFWRSKENRISDYLSQISSFENSEAMKLLINILDDTVEKLDMISLRKYADCEDIYAFLKQFDSRQGERQQITVNSYYTSVNAALRDNAEQIFDVFDRLGMIKNNIAGKNCYDYIIITGGANNANLVRTVKAKEITDALTFKGTPPRMIAALSTYRKISEQEKEVVKNYAPGLEYEFDIISRCVEDVFFNGSSRRFPLYTDDNHADPTMSSEIMEFSKKYGKSTVCSYCAPKQDINRDRADTRDCLEFFFRKTDIPRGASILLVTSNSYCTSQFTADTAIENSVELDIVGSIPDHLFTTPDTIQCADYLNELIKTYAQFKAFRAKYGQ